MGRKDEIDKLIQAERKKLAIEDEKDAEYKEHQRQRLQVLRALLEEVAESIGTEYMSVRDGKAYLGVAVVVVLEGSRLPRFDPGDPASLRRLVDEVTPDAEWRICPNSTPDWDDAPGFVVELNNEWLTFQTEEEVIQYLLPEIAKKIAYNEHQKDRYKDQ